MRLSDLPFLVFGDPSFRGKCPTEAQEQVTFFAMLRREYPGTWGALGHLRAHTGSARGLIFAPGTAPAGVADALRAAGLAQVPVVVGGIIPDDDAARLRAMGVARVYTPKDFELNRIMMDIVALVAPKEAAA